MNRLSLLNSGTLAVLMIGTVVLVNVWVGSELNKPVSSTAPVILQPKMTEGPARPPLDENGMLVPIGAPTGVQPMGNPKAEKLERRIFEESLPDSTGDLAG